MSENITETRLCADHWGEAFGLHRDGYEFDPADTDSSFKYGTILWGHFQRDYFYHVDQALGDRTAPAVLAVNVHMKDEEWPQLALWSGAPVILVTSGRIEGDYDSGQPSGSFAAYDFFDAEGKAAPQTYIEVNCPRLFETETFQKVLADHHQRGLATWWRQERCEQGPDDYSDVFLTVHVEKCGMHDWHLTGCSCTLPDAVGKVLAEIIGRDHGTYGGLVRLTNLEE